MVGALMLPFRNQEGQNPFSASSRIRGDWLAKYMPELIIAPADEKKYLKELEADYYKDFDVFIFQKRFLDKADIDLALQLRGLGKKIIFDLCDAEWAHPERKENLRHMLDISHANTASTKFVADWLTATSNKQTTIIPDRIDLEQHELTDPPDNNPLKVGWFGNKLTIQYMIGIVEQVNSVHKDFDFGLRYIWECDYDYKAMGVPVEHVKWEVDTANKYIAECDIILNPHADDTIGKGKSNNKTITAWALGRPVIEDNFITELPMYLNSRNLRMAAGLSGRKDVVEKYDVHDSVKQLRQVIKDVCE